MRQPVRAGVTRRTEKTKTPVAEDARKAAKKRAAKDDVGKAKKRVSNDTGRKPARKKSISDDADRRPVKRRAVEDDIGMPAKKKVAKEDVGKVAKMRAVQRNPGQEVRKKMVVEVRCNTKNTICTSKYPRTYNICIWQNVPNPTPCNVAQFQLRH